jgi:hypothetical protein
MITGEMKSLSPGTAYPGFGEMGQTVTQNAATG